MAKRLRADGINVTLDQWHAVPGDHLPDFMASSIQTNDFVLIICTPSYKRKVEGKTGGAKYEGDLITSELFVTQNQRKFIPVLSEGEWIEASPSWLVGKLYIDLRGEHFEKNYEDLVLTLKKQRPQPPPIGNNRSPNEITEIEMDKEQGTRFLEQELEETIQGLSEIERTSMAIGIFDVDDLTRINIMFGKEVGDEVLSIIGSIIKKVEQIQYFGRCGDDTFYAILTEVNETDSLEVFLKITRNIRKYKWNRVAPDLYVSCSVGFSLLRKSEHPYDWVIRAITGMLLSKRDGGNTVTKGPKFYGKKPSIAAQLSPDHPLAKQDIRLPEDKPKPLKLRKFFS